ncbi:MAG: class I adenylate-forming enzyme family protein [Xanthobacteraceae bacterium]
MATILTLLSSELIRQYYAEGFWRDETIYALVAAHARRAPDAYAVRDRYRRVSYGEFVAAADRLATDLARRGIKPGQRVAVWLPSRIECAVALTACSRNGYVCCPSLHRDHTVTDVLGLLTRIRAAALVAQSGYGADADRRDIFAELSGVASLRHIYRLEPLNEDHRLFAAVEAQAIPEPLKQDPNQIVYLAFTSGTTGDPKGVMHSDNTLLANARAMASDWGIDAGSVVYSLSPLSHNLGFGAMVMALAAGAELVVHDLPKGASLADRVVETNTSFMVGVPTHANDLLEEMSGRDLKRLGRLQGFRISGAAASPELVTSLLERGVVPQSGYGMTEACSHQYTLPGDDPRLIVETSGRACAGYEIRIWRSDDRDVQAEVGEVGEIGGRGASLMLGYFDDQQATEDSFNAQGYFMTGDLGWMDANGYLRVTGRKKDVIIRGGHNIYPARIEALAMRHAAVERAAAIPVRDARLGEKVCLAVVYRAGGRLEPEGLLAHLEAAGLSKYDMPEYVLELDHMPTTASGKMRKRDLMERIERGEVTPAPVRWQARSGSGEVEMATPLPSSSPGVSR